MGHPARFLMLLVTLMGLACATPATDATDTAGGDLLVRWYDLQLTLIRETPNFTPPVAARALAYTGIALWESLVPGMTNGQSLAGELNGLPELPVPTGEYHAAAAANHALARIIRELYPNAFAAHLFEVDQLEQEIAEAFARDVDAETMTRSKAFGTAIADAVLTWSFEDGGGEAYVGGFFGFTPSDAPGAWVPTPRRNGPPFPPLQPYWGENRPLVLESGDTCMAPPPPAYSEEPGSAFYAEAREVYETVRSITPEQLEIAKHWADDPGQTSTPAGHWVAILNTVVRGHDLPLDVAAEGYVRLGVALNDGFISCWSTKFHYNLLRPITYIQRVIDPTWNTPAVTDPIITPPFPEYTSGHSVISAAAATVLTDLLGEVAFTDATHSSKGQPAREYASFNEAAREAAMSRLYGGIHYRSAIEEGQAQGRCIAERVNALNFRGSR
jgi:hypothetical protein